jgi:hypothetical protein
VIDRMPKPYGLLRGLLEALWPWSRTRRELRRAAKLHGTASRIVYIECWPVPLVLGFRFYIEINRRDP